MITRTLLCLLLGVTATGCLFFETGSTNNPTPDMTTTPDMTEPDMPSANNCEIGCAELAVEPYSCDGEVLNVFVKTEVDSDCSCVVVYDEIDCAASGQTCDEVRGECVDDSPGVCAEDIDCGPGQACCDEECLDVSADADNCGGCGYTCVEGAVCSDSLCLCQPAPSTATEAPPARWTQLSTTDENILANPPPLLVPFLNRERVDCDSEGCSLLPTYPPTSAHHIAVYSRNAQSFSVKLLDELGSVLASALESGEMGQTLLQIRAFQPGEAGAFHLAALWGSQEQTRLQIYRVDVEPGLGTVGLQVEPLVGEMISSTQAVVDFDVVTWDSEDLARLPVIQGAVESGDLSLRTSALSVLTYLTQPTPGAHQLNVVTLLVENGAPTRSQSQSFDLTFTGDLLPGTWSTGAGIVQDGAQRHLGVGAAFMTSTSTDMKKQVLNFGQVEIRARLTEEKRIELGMDLHGPLVKLGEFFKATSPDSTPTRVNVGSGVNDAGKPTWEVLDFLANSSNGEPAASEAINIRVQANEQLTHNIDTIFTLAEFGFQGSATLSPPDLTLFVSWIVSPWRNGDLGPQRQIHYSIVGAGETQMFLLDRDAEFTSTQASFGTRGAGVLAHVRVPGNSSIRFYPVISGQPYCGIANTQP